jgi:hypothetical protein
VKQDVSVSVATEATATPDEPSRNDRVDERSVRGDPRDEATRREQDRRSTLDEVKIAYTLLLEDLGLPEQDEKDLMALLVDMRMEGLWSSYQEGRTISAQERSDRISAVIGPEKLEQLLTLERNGQEYWETYQIALLLQRRGVPTTPAQRDEVFDILVEVHERYPFTKPAELDERSEQYIRDVLRQLDDTDRHVVELAPSVLSPTQVAHLFEAYDYMSRERVNDVEFVKKWKIQHPGDDPGWITSARWNPR